MTDVLATPKGRVIKLADGKDYQLSPMNLTTLADLEEAFDCDLSEMMEKLKIRSATKFRKILHVLLMDGYPEITVREAGKLVDATKLTEITGELLDILTGIEA